MSLLSKNQIWYQMRLICFVFIKQVNASSELKASAPQENIYIKDFV